MTMISCKQRMAPVDALQNFCRTLPLMVTPVLFLQMMSAEDRRREHSRSPAHRRQEHSRSPVARRPAYRSRSPYTAGMTMAGETTSQTCHVPSPSSCPTARLQVMTCFYSTFYRGTEDERSRSTTVYVGNIPYSFIERDVAELFERYGLFARSPSPWIASLDTIVDLLLPSLRTDGMRRTRSTNSMIIRLREED